MLLCTYGVSTLMSSGSEKKKHLAKTIKGMCCKNLEQFNMKLHIILHYIVQKNNKTMKINHFLSLDFFNNRKE